jgi:DNA end-binding protein Ku
MTAPPRKVDTLTISFGLVCFDVGMYPVHKENQDTSFKLFSECHGKPVRYLKVCEECKQEVHSPKKGVIISKAAPVLLEDNEIEKLPSPSTFLKFIPISSISPLLLRGEDYYLAPEKGAEKIFHLIFGICQQLGIGILMKQMVRGKERLIFIRTVDGRVVASYLYYQEEMREAPEIPPLQVKIDEKEMKLAVELIKQLIEEPNLAEIKNETAEAIRRLVEAKMRGAAPEVERKEEVREVIDLLKALEIQLQMKKKKEVKT